MTQTLRTTNPPALSTIAKVSIVGLLTAAVGILIQYLALPEDFPTVPPGPIILSAAAAIVGLGVRWWWSPLVGLGVAVMIAVGGVLTDGFAENLSDSVGPAMGAAVMLVGLFAAIAAGVLTIAGRPRGDDRRPSA